MKKIYVHIFYIEKNTKEYLTLCLPIQFSEKFLTKTFFHSAKVDNGEKSMKGCCFTLLLINDSFCEIEHCQCREVGKYFVKLLSCSPHVSSKNEFQIFTISSPITTSPVVLFIMG